MRISKRALWRDQRGFTLAEVMITVIIIGIVMAIASSTYSRVVQGRQVDSATNQLVADMRLAHTQSTNRLTEFRIAFRPNGQQVNCNGQFDYCLVEKTGTTTYAKTGRDLPDGAEIRSTTLGGSNTAGFTANPSQLQFNSSGSVSSPGGFTGTTMRITIRPVGATDPSHVIDVNAVTSRVQVDPQ